MPYQIQFRMPHGVALRQDQTGLLRVTYEVGNISAMREMFEKLRAELLESAIQVAQQRKADELKRQQLPADRLTVLDGEIKALEAQRGA